MSAAFVRRLLRDRVLAVTVTGASMEPALHDGDRVLVVRRRFRRLTRGQVVVLRPPPPAAAVAAGRSPGPPPVRPYRDGGVLVLRQPPPGPGGLVVKRIAAAPGDPVPAPLAARLGPTVPAGRFLVLGDNPARSLDSRHFGFVPRDRLVGVVIRPLRTPITAAGKGE
ncbi:S26 family signal peptidase [Streptomyces sp. NPDC090022]|uniref:S26 family signal peptidase n=1 Tax=Streptomyces sp. NPDC090022 TaxID=3365920 RepID=UPI00380C7205